MYSSKLIAITLFSLIVSWNANGQSAKIFWTEGNQQQLFRINDDGSGKQLLAQDEINRPSNIQYYDSQVYFTDHRSIIRFNENSSELETLIEGQNFIDVVYLDKASDKIFWAERLFPKGSNLFSSDLDGSNIQLMFESPETINALTIDPSNGLMYFATSSQIFRLDKDMQSSILLVEGYNDIRTLVIDPDEGRMIWYDERLEYILISNLNGAEIETIFDAEFSDRPVDIFVDTQENTVYWLDKRDFLIKGLDYMGNEIETLMDIGEDNPFNGFYTAYYDFEKNKLFWGHTDGFIKSKGRNDDSSQILLDDEFEVIQNLWADNTSGKLYLRQDGVWAMNASGTDQMQVLNNGDSHLAVQVYNGYFYYHEPLVGYKRAKLDGTGTELLVDGYADGFDGYTSFDIDYENSTIHHTRQSCSCVESYSITGGITRTIYRGSDVQNLVFDRDENVLAWTDCSEGVCEIISRGSGLSGPQSIYNTTNAISSMAMDRISHKLYWLEFTDTDGKILSSNYDGSALNEITLTEGRPRSIAVMSSVDFDQDGFDCFVDCDDADPNIHPDAEEILDNDIDEDCDGIAQVSNSSFEEMTTIKNLKTPWNFLLLYSEDHVLDLVEIMFDGQVILSNAAGKSVASINLKELSPNTYQVKVTSGNEYFMKEIKID